MDRSTQPADSPVLKRLVEDLAGTLGVRLNAVILYGSAARGDYRKGTSDFNIIIVMSDLEPGSLEAVTPIIRKWMRRGQPAPRLFSPQLIREATDVFPIEFLDIRQQRVVLHGGDPFDDLPINRDHLRLQCERELREKMMRLREGYIEAGGSARALTRLLTDSYTTFVALFRGCLHLLGGEVPVHNRDVVAAFCARAGLDRSVFDDVHRLKDGNRSEIDVRTIFTRYYDTLTQAVHRIDRFDPHQGGGEKP